MIHRSNGPFDPHRRSGVAIRHDRLDWAFRFADAAVDAVALPDHKHVLAFVEAIHRTDRDTVRIFAPYTAIGHDERHAASLWDVDRM